jgi:hypothetical protein
MVGRPPAGIPDILTYANQRLSILVNHCSTEMIKLAMVLSDPLSAASHSFFSFLFLVVGVSKKKKKRYINE